MRYTPPLRAPVARPSALTLLLALLLLLPARKAHALTQPDGTVIPVRMDLQSLLNARGETGINTVRDAADEPERFVPGCNLTFTLVSRGAALFQNAFGWYNVVPGAHPADSDLHVLIPCGASAGFVAHLDLAHEPAFRGGELGFFLRTPESAPGSGTCTDCCGAPDHQGITYYTEREYNPDNRGAGSYIHLLTYDSSVTPAAFYFAWEDLYGGGDNEFADFVAEVSNIVCAGSGASCSTGMAGVCAAGTMQCHAGHLTCVGLNHPGPEVCNGLDNNCDGRVDDSDSLCPTGRVCDRGSCVPRCVEGSCFAGQTCTARGTCIETACAAVTCPAEQRCVAGRCAMPCDGVYCPPPAVCRVGRCVDPCAGVTCDATDVCDQGSCVPRCQCRRCAMGSVCLADGHCAPADCAMVSCPAGQTCRMGACVDACVPPAPDQTVCGRGERCALGQCMAIPPGSDAGAADAGHGAGDDAGARDAGRAAMDGGAPSDASAGASDGGGLGRARGGCGCRAVTGGHSGRGALASIASIAAALACSERQRRRRGRH